VSGFAPPAGIKRPDRPIGEDAFVGGHACQVVDPGRGDKQPVGRVLAERPGQLGAVDRESVIRVGRPPDGSNTMTG
jgi:hypothetical protein